MKMTKIKTLRATDRLTGSLLEVLADLKKCWNLTLAMLRIFLIFNPACLIV